MDYVTWRDLGQAQGVIWDRHRDLGQAYVTWRRDGATGDRHK